MKKYSSLVIAFFAIAAVALAAPPDKEAIKAKETTAWQSFKDKKADEFKKVVSPKVVAVYADGIADMQKELADMQKWDMKSFAISDYKVTSDGSDTVVTTYTVLVEGTVDGKDMSGTYNAGSVWKQEKGTWMAIFHTNIKQEAAAPTPATTP
jgi:hypothetical protein